MDATRITSRQHSFVQRCRAVARRLEPGTVLLDGEHLVAEAIDAGIHLEGVLTDGQPRPALDALDTHAATWYVGSDAILAAASPVRTTSGVVAVASWAPATIDDVLGGSPSIVVAMLGVQDPGNMGGIIRSAYALGASGIIALDGTADPGGWKALRGAMGGTFRLPVATGTLSVLFDIAAMRRIPLVATVAHGGLPVGEIEWPSPMILLLGNEGQGLPDAAVARCSHRVRLPLRSGAESLNVGVTAAIVLWEARPR
jgi:RNA methyltransferase, TrmH family